MKVLSKGIDISKHNGKIDWMKVNKNEVQFVIIRVGFGTSAVDTQFKVNMEGAIKAGIPIGLYYFSYAGTIAQAEKEAEFCLKTIASYKKNITYPVFFDWEYDSYDYCIKQGITPTKTLVSNMAIAFMNKIKSAGYNTGNYSNPDYLNRFFNDEVKNKWDTWLAHVGVNGTTRMSTNYSGKYCMWQYSWKGKFAGISGDVDMDYCYVEYVNKTSTIEQTIEQTVNSGNKKYLVDYSKEQQSKVVNYNLTTQGNLFLSPHFQVKEFKSPDTNAVFIDNRLIWILERLFKDLNCSKMIINSGYRTPSYSIKVGGTSTDTHVKGRASDITCYNKQGKVIDGKTVCMKLESYGDVFGIGYISETSVHCDTRQKSGIWFGDEIKGVSLLKSGYASFKEYFNAKTLKVNNGTWNVRSEPNTKGKILTVVKGGSEYKLTTVSNTGWAYIPSLKGYLSKSGYVIK